MKGETFYEGDRPDMFNAAEVNLLKVVEVEAKDREQRDRERFNNINQDFEGLPILSVYFHSFFFLLARLDGVRPLLCIGMCGI